MTSEKSRKHIFVGFSLTARILPKYSAKLNPGILSRRCANRSRQPTAMHDAFTRRASTSLIPAAEAISAADALVVFLSARFELGWMGSAVVGMEQGYLRSETAAAATVHLTPVWRLDTDTGSFYVNGITGEVTPT